MNLFSLKKEIPGLEWWSKNNLILDEVGGMNIWENTTKGIYNSLVDIDYNEIPFKKFSEELIKIRFELILLAYQQMANEAELVALHEGLDLFCSEHNLDHLIDSESSIVINFIIAHLSYQFNDSNYNNDTNKVLRKCGEFLLSGKRLSINQKIENRKGISKLINEGYFFGSFSNNILGILTISMRNRVLLETMIKGNYKFGLEKLKDISITSNSSKTSNLDIYKKNYTIANLSSNVASKFEPDLYHKFIIRTESESKIYLGQSIMLTVKDDKSFVSKGKVLSNIYYRLMDDRKFKVLDYQSSKDEIEKIIEIYNNFDLSNIITEDKFYKQEEIENIIFQAWERIRHHAANLHFEIQPIKKKSISEASNEIEEKQRFEIELKKKLENEYNEKVKLIKQKYLTPEQIAQEENIIRIQEEIRQRKDKRQKIAQEIIVLKSSLIEKEDYLKKLISMSTQISLDIESIKNRIKIKERFYMNDSNNYPDEIFKLIYDENVFEVMDSIKTIFPKEDQLVVLQILFEFANSSSISVLYHKDYPHLVKYCLENQSQFSCIKRIISTINKKNISAHELENRLTEYLIMDQEFNDGRM